MRCDERADSTFASGETPEAGNLSLLGIVWIDPNAYGSQPQFVIGE
jgi:hypothetical protein